MSQSTEHDSDELQALFDEISSHAAESPDQESPGSDGSGQGGLKRVELYKSIGNLVRRLHEALKELGQESVLQKAESVLPESRERLSFIGDLMEKSATQCIFLTEQEMPRIDATNESLGKLKTGWDKVVSGASNVEEFKQLALSTPQTLQQAIDGQKQVKNSLMEILMAQGFQDLAGQTLGKVIMQVKGFERELLELLALAAEGDPESKEKISEFLEGPQFKKTDDAVHSQSEVDDLLKELGF